MSGYPAEADEAQHGHYNDGFNPYSSPYQHHFSDPFFSPQSYNSPNSFITPPPPPPLPPQPTLSNLLSPYHPAPIPSPTPLHDRYYDDHDIDHDDTTDIPLLRRDPSTTSIPMPIPGSYEEETNIRYGRIPQRIPRRYKTIKRVEYVQIPQSIRTQLTHLESGSSTEISSSTTKSPKSYSTCAPCAMSANLPTCATQQQPVTPTTLKTPASPSVKYITTPRAAQNSSLL
jgi:hypothetical protein